MDTTTLTATAQFTVGRTYQCRAFSDYDTVYSFTVLSRTARFVTLEDAFGDVRRVGVYVSHGAERALPHGRYANAAVISADRPV